MDNDWKAELEAQANKVYDDKAVVLAWRDRVWADTKKHLDDCIEKLTGIANDFPSEIAIQLMEEIKESVYADQRKTMREGLASTATADDRFVAERMVEFTNIHIEVIDAFIEAIEDGCDEWYEDEEPV